MNNNYKIILLIIIFLYAGCKDEELAPLGGFGDGGTFYDPGPGGGGAISRDSDDTDSDTDDTDTSDCESFELENSENCWMRCNIGQTWDEDGKYCTDFSDELDRNAAMAACQDLDKDYHLATDDEIIALLGGCEDNVLTGTGDGVCDPCYADDFCHTLFPEISTLWTGGQVDGMYRVFYMDTGYVTLSTNILAHYNARCVRQE